MSTANYNKKEDKLHLNITGNYFLLINVKNLTKREIVNSSTKCDKSQTDCVDPSRFYLILNTNLRMT